MSQLRSLSTQVKPILDFAPILQQILTSVAAQVCAKSEAWPEVHVCGFAAGCLTQTTACTSPRCRDTSHYLMWHDAFSMLALGQESKDACRQQ